MPGRLHKFYQQLKRRKTFKDEDMEKTEFSRCLGIVDLTALGIGSTLGAGAYVLAGQVAKSDSGPAVVLSFLIAAFASVLAGLCYAEFGARVPKAGSAYIYTYVSTGEIMAFIIGWNLILEYVIGAASIARTASGYVDAIAGDILVPWFNRTAPLDVPTFAPYCDLLAVAIVLVLTVILACGVKESVTLNKLFTGINLCILFYVMIAGLFKDDPANWNIPEETVLNNTQFCSKEGACGVGGFMPFGLSGVIQGAAACFYAFIGFDVIATTGEEAINPQKSIPIATILSLTIVFFMYFGVSTTITMMVPYFSLDETKPFAEIFDRIGWTVAKYVISVGAICALTTSLLGAMFPLPRIIYAMGRDGLIFKFFGRINDRVKTPVVSTIFAGILAAILAAVFDVESLVEMMSIGTFLAYSLVAASVLILRYEVAPEDVETAKECSEPCLRFKEELVRFEANINEKSDRSLVSRIFRPSTKYPTTFSAHIVKLLICFLIFWIVVFCAILRFFAYEIFNNRNPTAIAAIAFSGLLVCGATYAIAIQPQSCKKLFFKVPLIAVLPTISIAVNVYLMLNLHVLTWIRFAVWMVIGLLIYFCYGLRHSAVEKAYKNRGSQMDDHMEIPGPSENFCNKNHMGSESDKSPLDSNGKHRISINVGGFDDIKL